MLRKIFSLGALAMAMAASAFSYQVNVELSVDDEGAMAYLTNYDNGAKLDSALVENAQLCFEGQRYENLIRWGDAAAALAKNGEKNPVLHPDGTVGWESFNAAGKCGFKAGKHELLPFPSKEVMVNSNIQQNPNW